jgi:hypothetical protein
MATKRPTTPSHQDFEYPPAPAPAASGSGTDTEFEAPDEQLSASAEAVESEAAAFLGSADEGLLATKQAIEQLLGRLAGDAGGIQSQDAMDANVVGVGIGVGDGTSPGTLPGDPVLEVYTIEPEAPSQTCARLASAAGLQALAAGEVPIQTVCTGVIDASQHRMRLRPAPGGISIGHVRITAGTQGCLVRGRSGARLNRLMVLSNNHVLANSNAAAIGDAIVQPGPFDGGRAPADQVAILERFVPIHFAGGHNLVDAATGWAWPDRVRRELMYLSGGAVRYFRVGSTPVAAVPGLGVGKSGRTTQLTSGRVTAVGVTINVNFGGGRVARFVNQIAIRAASGNFSQGGDSGSLIWTWDARRAPVGLLFAGGGGTTFANRITDVLAALDVNLVT